MRFLADENFPGAAVAFLRTAGHDVVWVLTGSPGKDDEGVLAWAIRENQILLTFDKDCGELAANAPSPVSGVILFRLQVTKPMRLNADWGI